MKLPTLIGCILLLAMCTMGFIGTIAIAADVQEGGPGPSSSTSTYEEKVMVSETVEPFIAPEKPVVPFNDVQVSGDLGIAGWSTYEALGNPQSVGPYIDDQWDPLGASTRGPNDWNTFWWDNTNNKMGYNWPTHPTYVDYGAGVEIGMRNPTGAVSDDPNRVWVFIPETANYGNDIWVARWTPNSWTHPSPVPPEGSYRCKTNTGASAAKMDGGGFMMAWTDATTGNIKLVQHTGSATGSGWTFITDLGNYGAAFVSGPAICQKENYWWVFAKDQTGAIRYKVYNNGWSSTWSTVPSSTMWGGGSLSAVSRYKGQVDLFYQRSSDLYLVTKNYNPWTSSWSGETIMDPYNGDSDPVAVSWSPYRIDLFWTHANKQAYHMHWDTGSPTMAAPSPNYKDYSGSTTVTVDGGIFYPNSKVQIDGSDLSTTFVTASRLTAVVPPGLSSGTHTMRVKLPSDGASGDMYSTSSWNFYVHNTAPTITSTSPSSATQGTPSLSLAVLGTNFLSGTNAKVLVDGSERGGCTWDSATSVHVPLAVGDLDHTGTIPLKVQSRNTDGSWETSNTFNFNVVANPPFILSITPHKARHGTKVFIKNLAGTYFQQGATLTLEKPGLPTIYPLTTNVVSSTQITSTIKIPGKAKPGYRNVVVTNPDGGAFTKAAAFRILT